ncbi:hypothetical protein PORY_000376 [Pneumocystis oryctolagi]|uniref:Uncharacterized protein n=1 Tax=Pneumocystis oryctolagi TaxID=42067 RepID=A0ACB7CFJ5_9ASCO|nr:hypothetical protein PORY_000376 [Pneumocystis oryctolagi]
MPTFLQTDYNTVSYNHKPFIELKNLEKKQENKNFIKTVLYIKKISHFSCISTIKQSLKNDENLKIISVDISSSGKQMIIKHNIPITNIGDFIYGIERLGIETSFISSEIVLYETYHNENITKNNTIRLKIIGMTCAGCVNSLETVLKSIDGVTDAIINFATREVKINYFPRIVDIQCLIKAIKDKGYDADILGSDNDKKKLEDLSRTEDIKSWKNSFVKCLVFTIPLLFFEKIAPEFKNYNKIDNTLVFLPGLFFGDILSLLLTLPVQFGVGIRFYKSAFNSLKHKIVTMDTLVCLGTYIAFFSSILSMLLSILMYPHKRPTIFFETSSLLLTFITLGRYIENKAKGRTTEALSKLMSLNPSFTTIYINDTDTLTKKELVVLTESLKTNDIVIIHPGDKIPADGIIVSGESYINESMITGEPIPVHKQQGDKVYSGTVNYTGKFEFQTTKVGKDTRLSQILYLVQEAQTSRASIQKFTDKIASFFVLLVLFLGIMTFIVWMILSYTLSHLPKIFNSNEHGKKIIICIKLAISVIIIACPCALGLSTPTAIVVGTGVGAENGILFKNGTILETVSKITKVIFDKTGTLTAGHMSVNKVEIHDLWKNSEILWWKLIYISEQGSEHPIGKAIVSKAQEKLNLANEKITDYTVISFEAVIGHGIKCRMLLPDYIKETVELAIGNKLFIEEILENQDKQILNEKQDHLNKSYTRVYVAINKKFSGWISLSDVIKTNAVHAINALKHMKIDVLMATGDDNDIALKVGRNLGIPDDKIYSSITPEGKRDLIVYFQSQNETVAMVGDGINDSAALAIADIGIALSTGSDIAMEVADVVLTHSDPILDVPAAIHLSRTIFKRIKLNILWASIYNMISIPFAMGIFLPFDIYIHPIISGAAMTCSSISVILSSLLLRFWRRPSWLTDINMNDNTISSLSLKWKPTQFRFFSVVCSRNYYKIGYRNIYNDLKLSKNRINYNKVVLGIGLSFVFASVLHIFLIDTSPLRYIGLATIRTLRLISTAALCFNDYRRTINSDYSDEQERLYSLSLCHKRCAKRTLSCLKNNGGIFIKLGQHLSSMSYLIPYEWTSTMTCLQDKCPSSSIDDIKKMFLEDTGKRLEDYFSFFDENPVGVASLAQVHRAIMKENGREVAVKIQHPSLEKFTVIDIFLTKKILNSIKRFFPQFTLTWLTEEMEFSLLQELNFKEEEKNAVRIKKYFEKVKGFSVYIPEIIWSEKRILVMECKKLLDVMELFDCDLDIRGVRIDDHNYMLINNISRDEVSSELSHIFNEMIFGNDGYLHCDPHGGNLLIRSKPKTFQSKYNFEIVLLDHGLYRKIPLNLQRSYAKLWLSIINMNEKDMKQYSYEVAGISEDKFKLFTSAITGRDFKSLKKLRDTKWTKNEPSRITVVATRSFITQLVELLDDVPRIMLLLFKTNDLLRSLDESLKTTYGFKRNYGILRKYCARVIYKENLDKLYSKKKSRNCLNPSFFAEYLLCLWRYYSIEVSSYIYEWYLFIYG